MNKPNVEFVTIEIIVNWPRVIGLYTDPIEGLIRAYDGRIIHNVFSDTRAGAILNAREWVISSQFYEISPLPIHQHPEIEVYELGQLNLARVRTFETTKKE